MPKNTRILIVDDDPIVADSLADLLAEEGYTTATAHDGREALDLIQQTQARKNETPVGILITDVHMPRCDGMELLRAVRKQHPSIVPIVITGFGKIDAAVEAVKLGATDYLTKPVVDDELRLAVNKAVNQHALLVENVTLKQELNQRYGMGNLVGSDPHMQKVYDLIEAVAQSKTTVLITGDSGTGKSMVARAIHTVSPRKAEPFVTFSCGAIPETLLESELFGHVKGAFTGADTDKPGKCLAANGGTLFIDEINSATPALQLKLLRVLQEKAFEPVGSAQTTQVDIRFILASNQPLPALVEQGTFREDLYYRINVVNVPMPSLRDRGSDMLVLADHFLAKYCKEMKRERRLSVEVTDALRAHDWPGNVRELENAIERAVVLSRETEISLHDLPEQVTGQAPGLGAKDRVLNGQGMLSSPALKNGWTPTPLTVALEEPERQILLAALEANNWNRQETARQLDINRTTLYKKIKLFHLDEPG